ncbi:MAG: hypothetical protein PVI33_06215 [Candidatus Omnitrophota bacterium]|jgi:hypothetical protein
MKRGYFQIFLCLIIVLFSRLGYSQEQNLPLIVESKYFSVYGQKGLDFGSLLTKLYFDYLLHPSTALEESGNHNETEVLSKTLDALFLEVSDILDIHIYSFHGNIKLLADEDSINSQFRSFFKRNLNQGSFYTPENNTIYISFADLTLGMLGHEIAHAIISRYFVVPPPAKIQEVLSGYVEYSLRKSTGTLP